MLRAAVEHVTAKGGIPVIGRAAAMGRLLGAVSSADAAHALGPVWVQCGVAAALQMLDQTGNDRLREAVKQMSAVPRG